MNTSFQRELVTFVPRLRRFALSLTNSQADADDLVQSACERALRNKASFRPGTRMDSWLYRIIQNLWLDNRRRLKTRKEEVDPMDANLSDSGKGASEPTARLMLGKVQEAINELPDDQRVVLSMIAIEGHSYKDVAEALNISVGTVMSRLSRARQKLAPLASVQGTQQ